MTDGTGYSLSDIASLMQNKGDGLFGGNGTGFIVLILFLLLIGGNGFWGGAHAATAAQGATTAELYSSLVSQDLVNDVRSGFQSVNTGICGLNQSVLKGNYDTSLQLNSGFNGVTSAINNLGYQNQQCCCELKTAIHAEGEATRALINEQTITALRDKLADRDRELTAAQLTIQNTTQTRAILDSLGRYVTNPPCPQSTCGCGGF